MASIAAQEQGKFWEYHDKLFIDTRKLKPENLKQYAQETGLDMAQFEKALQDGGKTKIIEADKSEAAAVQVRGTPAFFVNGRFLGGAKPFKEFEKLINAELVRLKLPVPQEAKVQ
jgi:protein-disulfide isomerase